MSLLMPSISECDDFSDKDNVRILTSHGTYLVPSSGDDWTQSIKHSNTRAPSGNYFTLFKISPPDESSQTCQASQTTLWNSIRSQTLPEPDTCMYKPIADSYFALRAPNGKFLAVSPQETISATYSEPFIKEMNENIAFPLSAIFLLSPLRGASFTLLSLSNAKYLRAWDDGTLELYTEKQSPISSLDIFKIHKVEMIPKFFGVNLGGWLVSEEWMNPKWLFDGVHKDITDGTKFNLYSCWENKWVAAEGGGGKEIVANRDSPSGWETFHVTTGGGGTSGAFFFHANNAQFWSVDPKTRKILANKNDGGDQEKFFLRHNPKDASKVHIRAFNNYWVRVGSNQMLYADIDSEPQTWDTNATFELKVTSKLGGEYQLGSALGRAETEARLSRHRAEWVTRADFEWMRDSGVNSVRIPIGWWIASDVTPPPFVPGSLAYLDKAFEWSGMYGIRVVICIHAAPGSQNGWEHSASDDGFPRWGKSNTSYIDQTLALFEFLASRYCKHPYFFGIEAINEPRADAVTIQVLSKYYQDAYAILRQFSKTAYFIIAGRIYASDVEWKDFMIGPQYTNVIFDVHWYHVHDHNEFGNKSPQFNIDYPSTIRAQALSNVERGDRLVIVGEWSLGLLCKCSDDIYRRFGKAQVDCYASSSAGFFFWSLKHGQGWRAWSFQECVKSGWLDPSWWSLPKPDDSSCGLQRDSFGQTCITQ